jgi:hypothetical protein
MSNEVYANNNEVSCKAAAGKSICSTPDVCMTPPQTPATPPGVPIPYPNTGMASDCSDGSSSVKISGQEVMLKNKSYFKKSSGDEAGSAPMKGVVTSCNAGKIFFTAWSMDVLVEGENVVRNLDLTTHNHSSEPGNTPPWLYQDESATVPTVGCEDEAAAVTDNCAGKTKKQQCKEPCKGAKKCALVTYRQGKQTGKKSNVACCPKDQPHHLVESHGLCVKGKRGTALPQFQNPVPYDPKSAPCVCAKGSRFKQEHGGFHALQGKKESAAFNAAKPAGKEYAWKYKDAKAAGISAHKAVYPDSGCSKKCMEAQLDKFHETCGVDDETPLRTYDAADNLSEWQLQKTVKAIIDTMKKQLGSSNAGVGFP